MVLKTQRYTGRAAQGLPSLRSRFAASQLKPVLKGLLIPAVALAPFALTFACGGETKGTPDKNGGHLADGIGSFVDANADGFADTIDINGDGVSDGFGLDTNGDGKTDALALDLDCDGVYESYDKTGDGVADVQSGAVKLMPPASCKPVNPISHGGGAGAPGTAGAPGLAGAPSMGGAPSMAGAPGAAGMVSRGGSPGAAGAPATAGSSPGGGANVIGQLGKGSYTGSGDSTVQFAEGDVTRDGVDGKSVGYKFIANGWGTKWQNHSISWKGTSFTVKSLNGTQGDDYSPAGYPTMFCGLYSKKQSDTCGLPITITAAKSIKTGWRWKANGNTGQYNAAWDIWLGNGGTLSAYLMVWLRDPPGQQPAGAAAIAGATVTGLPGTWNIWKGSVNGLPIVNYVQPEGKDLGELEFDALDVYKDAIKRNYSLPGAQILAVAVGYEVWNGPVTNLVTDDFYVDVK